MKNKEKYLDEMLTMFNKNEVSCLFKKKYVVKNCNDIGCIKCEELFKTWLEEEYIKLEINWEEVPYNTKVYVRENEHSDWKLRTFVCYNPKYFEPFVCVANAGKSAVGWKYAKLVDERDITKYKKVN